ncbi:glycosyl hydrolase [Paludibacter sp.]|uniref:glycoside hydrolase family 26 protein n=1 Tax=Paludibacter sp. TaxID=1898105 RepID=UPI0025F9B385|nr:glycosyl hydrolase [Paludibacter sp.]
MKIRLIPAILSMMCVTMPAMAKSATVDANATKETKALFANLKKIASKGFMFGHQDDALYGVGWKYDAGRSDVKSVSGDYPSVFGWELGNIELEHSHSLDSVCFDTMRLRIKEVYKRGGVNTISWHVNNPLGGNAWNCNTTEAVKSALPGGSKNALFQQWLNRLAAFLKSLKDDKGTPIPVLLRPYHEHTGAWFWWGSKQCTVQEYTALWKYTVNYLIKTKKLHNLLFIYSPASAPDAAQYFERYPGDNMVDVLGVDIYHYGGEQATSKFINEVHNTLNFMTAAAAAKNKVAVLSETGIESLPLKDWWTNVIYKAISGNPIAYFLVWRNACDKPGHFYAPYPGQASADDFILFKNKANVIFESKLPPMYK